MPASDVPTSGPDFHAQAYDELKSKTADRELWARAIADSEGDRARAVSQYIRERAKALQAHAEAATPKPVNAWDYKQVPNLPATRRPPWILIALLGLWLFAFMFRSRLPAASADGLVLVLAGSMGHVLGALALGAGPGLVALGINEVVARISKAPRLPVLRLFAVVSIVFAYLAMLGVKLM